MATTCIWNIYYTLYTHKCIHTPLTIIPEMGPGGSSTLIWRGEQKILGFGTRELLMWALVLLGSTSAGVNGRCRYGHCSSTVLCFIMDRSKNLRVKDMVVGVYGKKDHWDPFQKQIQIHIESISWAHQVAFVLVSVLCSVCKTNWNCCQRGYVKHENPTLLHMHAHVYVISDLSSIWVGVWGKKFMSAS